MPPSSLNACVTSYGEVVRLTGMRRDGFCRAVPSGSTARYFSPSSVLIMIEARCGVADPGVLDPEGDLHPPVVQGHPGDLADLDARDAYLVAGVQPGRLGEVRAVRRAAADDGQVVGGVRGRAQAEQDHEADDGDRDGVALPDRFHDVHLDSVIGMPVGGGPGGVGPPSYQDTPETVAWHM